MQYWGLIDLMNYIVPVILLLFGDSLRTVRVGNYTYSNLLYGPYRGQWHLLRIVGNPLCCFIRKGKCTR